MKNNKEYIPDKKKFIENYKGIDIFHTAKNGYEIAGYYLTYYNLSDTREVINHCLNTGKMKVSENKGLIFV